MEDPFGIELTPQQWFNTNVSYIGMGRAEFLSPQGVCTGPATIQFDEFGESTIEMEVGHIDTAENLHFGDMQFFSGQTPRRERNSISIGLGSFDDNPCAQLTVTTTDGIFSAIGDVSYAYLGRRLRFWPLHPHFDVSGAEPAKYWVVPLVNFVSKFRSHHADIDQHPLRIFPTPRIPDGLPASELHAARNYANSRNNLIVFEFGGSTGFIEPLPDVEERTRRLLSRRERHAVTAIMVGNVGSEPIDVPALDQWFPFVFLDLLGVTSGSAIGAPWIEFRDEAGKLVRRVHMNLGHPSFSEGRTVINEDRHRGTGRLLTQAASSPTFRQSRLHVLLRHLVEAGHYSNTIEERLIYIVRALDGLCGDYGLSKQYLLQGLDATQQNAVRAALRNAAAQIRAQGAAAVAAGKHDQSRLLHKIADRTQSNPANVDRDFGLAVADLLRQFSLPDADIVDAHYQQHPRPDGIATWSGVLSAFRGVATHHGYFDFRGGSYDVNDTITITNHLHDILVRIALSMVGYDGVYQPLTTRWTAIEPVDWVQPSTSAGHLGYT